jgi:hypothetical protein
LLALAIALLQFFNIVGIIFKHGVFEVWKNKKKSRVVRSGLRGEIPRLGHHEDFGKKV